VLKSGGRRGITIADFHVYRTVVLICIRDVLSS
jgi:hypothetical protein